MAAADSPIVPDSMVDSLAAILPPHFVPQAVAAVALVLAGHFLLWQPYRRRQLANARQGLERDRRRIAAVLMAMAELVRALEEGIVHRGAAAADLRDDFAALARAAAHPDASEDLAELARRFERRALALARAMASGEGNAALMPMLQSLYAMHIEGSAMATRVSMQVPPPQR